MQETELLMKQLVSEKQSNQDFTQFIIYKV